MPLAMTSLGFCGGGLIQVAVGFAGGFGALLTNAPGLPGMPVSGRPDGRRGRRQPGRNVLGRASSIRYRRDGDPGCTR